MEPITEGRPSEALPNPADKKAVIQVQTTGNVPIRPIIKVSSADSLVSDCDRGKMITPGSLDVVDKPACPTYENLDFLRNDKMFSRDAQKVSVKNLAPNKPKVVDKPQFLATANENNLRTNFSVHLRTVPKNFTRNRFKAAESGRSFDDPVGKHALLAKQTNVQTPSNISLGSMDTPLSDVANKFVKNLNTCNKGKELASSSLDRKGGFTSRDAPGRSSLSRHRYTRDCEDRRTPLLQRTGKFQQEESPCKAESSGILAKVLRRTPIFERKSFKQLQMDSNIPVQEEKVSSSSVVRNIVESFNKKSGGLSFGSRGGYGRSSMKVMGNPKVNLKGLVRGSLDNEFTAL